MILDDMLFSKSTPRSESCEPTMVLMGIDMSVCVIITVLLGLAALIGCIVFVFCVKYAVERDMRRASRKSRASTIDGPTKTAVDGAPAIIVNAGTPTDEQVGLTKIVVDDEIPEKY